MTPGERSTDEKLDALSLTLDWVLGIVQGHSGDPAELKTEWSGPPRQLRRRWV